MGGMSPDEFLLVFVEGNYHDFFAEEASVRHGFNAVVPAFHMADHYFHYCKRHAPTHRILKYGGRKGYLKYLSSKSEYFNDVQSIANAYKHLYQRNKNEPHVTVSSAGTIGDLKSSDFEMEGDVNYVIYTRKSNNKVKFRLLEALQSVINLWKEEIEDCPS